MSKLFKSKFLLGVMIVAIMFVGVVAVSATTASADCTVVPTVRAGSTGTSVACVQSIVGATADGKFGPMTKIAVQAYQTANNLTADGVVGPMTAAVMNGGTSIVTTPGCSAGALFNSQTGASCTVTATPGCSAGALFNSQTGASCSTTGPLTGGAGDITVSSLSTYSGEKVKAGDNDVKVLGIEIEADNGSDVQINSLKIELKQTDTDSSQRITDYVDSVGIFMGSTKVGSADASDFTETSTSDIYAKSVSLSNATIKAGEKARFYIALDAVSSFDSGDIDDENFSIDILSSRFTDAEGVVTTDTTNVTAREADFEDLSTSGDIDVKISKNTASPSMDKIVEVDDTTNTNDVLLLAVDLKPTGTDVEIDTLTFDITPTGADVTMIVNEYKLVVNGEEISSIAAATIADGVTGTIQFTDLKSDFKVSAGETAVVKLLADINDTQGTDFIDGDSILASLTSTNFNATNTTIKDENSDTVVNGDRTGSVTGKTMSFWATGMVVTPVGSSSGDAVVFDTDANAADTARGDFKIRFNVTAMGMDVYLDKGISESSSTSSTPAGTNRVLVIKTGTGASSTDVTLGGLQAVNPSQVTIGTNTYMVAQGDTVEFVLSVSSDVNPDAEIQAVLYALEWGNADTATGDSVYTFNMGNTGSYASPSKAVAD